MDKARREDTIRWGLGLLLAVGMHVGVAFGVIVWNADRPPPPSPPPAVMIELAALPAAPPPKPSEVPPEPKQEEAEPPPPEPEQPAPKPEAPAPGTSSAQPTNTVQTWQQRLLAHIERHKRYLGSARRRRQEGVTYLRFVMNREGQVLSARIEHSSGYATLDEETQALIKRAAPLPVPPPEVPGKQLEFVVPVQFFIR